MILTHIKARPDDKNRTFQVVGSCRVRPDNFGADNAFAFIEMSGCRVSVYTRVWVDVCSILLKEEGLLTFAIYGVCFLSGMTRQRLLY